MLSSFSAHWAWSPALLLLILPVWTQTHDGNLLYPDIPNPTAHFTVWCWPAAGCPRATAGTVNTLPYQWDSSFCLLALASLTRAWVQFQVLASHPQPHAAVAHCTPRLKDTHCPSASTFYWGSVRFTFLRLMGTPFDFTPWTSSAAVDTQPFSSEAPSVKHFCTCAPNIRTFNYM